MSKKAPIIINAFISVDGQTTIPSARIQAIANQLAHETADALSRIDAAHTAPAKPKRPKPVRKIPKAQRLAKGHGIYRRSDLTEKGWVYKSWLDDIEGLELTQADIDRGRNAKAAAADFPAFSPLVEAIPPADR